MNTAKVYDFPLQQVEGRLVSYLKRRGNESTVADMMAGTGLPKYQVEQAVKSVLDEYSGRLKVTESGEILYSFPAGMKSTKKGFGPAFKRLWTSFKRGAARVLSFLFKIWIVAMLVGYFLVFLALLILAIVAAFAASAAGGKNRESRSRRGGNGFGAMYLVSRLFELAFRMWFYSNLFSGGRKVRQLKPGGRAFYKSVFGYVFGEGDPNPDFDAMERTRVISYIRSRRGAISLEELMTLTGKESAEAHPLVNRYMLEFEGEPRVTENGTIVYAFPELLRTTESEQMAFDGAALADPIMKKTAPFSANKPKTNGWISFFNIFNLAFGSFFLVFPSTPGMDVVLGTGLASTRAPVDALTYFYSIVFNFLAGLGAVNPGAVITFALGFVPAAFSMLFFAIPILRSMKLKRENEKIRRENLRKLVLARILSNPERVDPRTIRLGGADSTPKKPEAVRNKIVEKFAAEKSAEPLPLPDGGFAYDFTELGREMADLEDYRRKTDLKSYEVGKTVFDSGQ
jgi:hypothetical protein